jgi:hypothetical protein
MGGTSSTHVGWDIRRNLLPERKKSHEGRGQGMWMGE